MGYEDRSYYRDSRGAGNPFMWLLTGSVPLFTAFGIRVRAHASLLLIAVLVLLFGFGQGAGVQARVQSVTMLFAIILLHEFGHCFGARWVGGDANEILLTPLGGLAMAMAPRNPWGQFVTVAAGPLVNVLICAVCGVGIYFLTGSVLLSPNSFVRNFPSDPGWLEVMGWLYWIYSISYWLLLFNLLPVFPLDGGQLLQAALWRPMGYFKSMMLTCNIGLAGSVLMVMVGLATLGTVGGGLLLTFIGISCFLNSFQMRAQLKQAGPWGFEEEPDYAKSLWADTKKTRRDSRRAVKRAQKLARQDAAERARIDAILAKVSAHGMHSLTWFERRALRKATEHQRQRDAELARLRGR